MPQPRKSSNYELPPHFTALQGDEVDQFVQKAATDTVFFCRNVLGMNADGDDGEPWKGGIRDHGPHRVFADVLDDWDKKLNIILFPRNGYKSSETLGHITQRCCFQPNWRGLYGMHDKPKAEERVATVRKWLESNPIIRYLFGDLKGPTWRKDRFITSLRNEEQLEPTLSCFSRDNLPTGGHYHDIYLDDLVDKESTKTPLGLQNGIDALKFCMPLRLPGGRLHDIGTLYHEGDLHHFILQIAQGWNRVMFEVGYEIRELADGRLDLTNENPDFPWLSKDFLMEQLQVMGFPEWMSQYKNRVVAGQHQGFKRDYFHGVGWKEEMQDFTGYLLTDVATSDKTEGAMNVLAMVGLDKQLNAYLFDLHVGHFQIGEFIQQFFAMRDRWKGKINYHAESMETTALNLTYKAGIEMEARSRGEMLNWIIFPRGVGTEQKDQRIGRLQPRLQNRRFFVCNTTIPRTFVDLGKTKALWDPEGWVDPQSNKRLPGGELVDQFVGWPTKLLKDIPDALAGIDELDKGTGHRFCFYKAPLRTRLDASIIRRRVSPHRVSSKQEDWHTRMARKAKPKW